MPELDSIACADCFDYLAQLPEASVDMVCTDPPYGTTDAPWDQRVDEDRLFDELWRIAKPAAPIIMFSQNPVAAELITLQRKNYRYEWIWQKNRPLGFLCAGKMPMRAHEIALVFYRRLPTFNDIPLQQQWRDPYQAQKITTSASVYHNMSGNAEPSSSEDGRRHPSTVVQYGQDVLNVTHGTPKPLALISMLIQQYTHYGEIVLDPFMGTGTTAAAAKACGRHFYGCERNAEFAVFARRRVDDTPPPLADFGIEGLRL